MHGLGNDDKEGRAVGMLTQCSTRSYY